MRRLRSLLGLLLILAAPSWAAITKNGSTYSQGATSVSSTSWTSGSFAIASGTNSVLVVSVMLSSNSTLTVPSATGLKWGGSGGAALTKVGYQQDAPDDIEVSLWYLIAPTVQTSTLYLTSADTMDVCAVAATVWDGAAQTTPFSGWIGSYSSWAADHEVTVTSATNSLVVDAIMTAHAIVCQQTQDALVYAGALNLGQSHKAGAASVVMDWVYDSCSHAMGGASLAPASGATPTPTPKQLFIITGRNTSNSQIEIRAIPTPPPNAAQALSSWKE